MSGIVFRDYNSNGIRENTSVAGANNTTGSDAFVEPYVAGVTVELFNNAGSLGIQQTDTNGSYNFTGIPAGPYRVEFKSLRQGDFSSVTGTGNNTSIQFLPSAGGTANFSINYPADYYQQTPILVTPQQIARAYNGSFTDEPALVGIPFSYGSPGGGDPDTVFLPEQPGGSPFTLATHGQIGSTYGTAWDRKNNTLFVSAFQKKHTGFGPEGAGAIYKLNVDPTTGVAGTPSLFVDVADFPGVVVHSYHGADLNLQYDATAASYAGKASLGDMDISDDHRFLYVWVLSGINAPFDNKLLEIEANTGNLTNTWTLPKSLPGSTDPGDIRPMAVKYYRGQVYVGIMNTAETTQNDTDIHAYIYKLDPAQGASAAFAKVVQFEPNGSVLNKAIPWITQNVSNAKRQYMFADIEFYGDDIIAGMRDRIGDQGGNDIPGANYNSITEGDVVTLWWDSSSNNYVLENNGSAGSNRPGSNPAWGYPDGEFYWGDGLNDSPLEGFLHREISIGGLAQIPGRHLALTSMNPFNPWNRKTESAGILWLNNNSGSPEKAYRLYDGGLNNDSTFGKANGLGDLEALGTLAPIEIGNRVWLDTNGNGIQDAGENGIPGVSVELRSGASVIATATTASDGTYYFSSATGTDTTSIKYGLTQLQPNTAYTVKFPPSVDVSGTTYNLTTANAGGNTLIDSNAPASGEVAVAAVDIPVAGANNHSFDVGYSASPACSINTPTITTTCDNNGTPSDASDDKFTYKITATGSNVGATYSTSGGDTYAGRSYGTEHTSSNSFPISGGNLVLTLTDDTTASCKLDGVKVTAPSTCSSVAPKTDLKLVKTASKTTVRKGDTLTYTLVLENESDVDATGVVVNDKLPSALTYVDHAPATANYNSTSGDWTVGTVPARQTMTLNINTKVN